MRDSPVALHRAVVRPRRPEDTLMRSITTCRRTPVLCYVLAVAAGCSDAPLSPASAPIRGAVAAARDARHVGLPAFSEELAALGDEIFDDPDLSLNRNQACNACHSAEWGFTGPNPAVNAGGAVYEGSMAGRFGDRKPPSSAYSTLSPVFAHVRRGRDMFVGGSFWDGRATGERLGSPAAEQALGPFLNPMEQALPDAACVVYRVSRAAYAADYVALWGDRINDIAFPAATDALCSQEGATVPLSPADRAKMLAEYDNIGYSIAIYEQSHALFSSKFDAARKGLATLTAQEQRGFALFQGKARCAHCHSSAGQQPAFTDHTYDNLGVPPNPANPFYRTHPGFVDMGLGGFLASRAPWAALASAEAGKMRVPTLRNVDLRPFPGAVKAYMHNGVFKSLEEVVHFYNTRDVLPRCGTTASRADWGVSCWPAPEVAANVNRVELGDIGLTADEEAAIVAFLRTLSDGHPAFAARR
jgi:cytochrome c peroxidase